MDRGANADKGEDLFRYKGVLAVKGMDQKFVFQGVHMLFGGGFSSEVPPWKEGETTGVPLRLHRSRSGSGRTPARTDGLQGRGTQIQRW